MKTSDAGLHLIMEREGNKTHAYLDSVGVWTIGVGHTGPEVHSGLVWTEQQVMDALRKDIERFEKAVNDAVTVELDQYQFDALVSFSFNVGETAFKNSTLVRKLNAGLFDEVPAQFDRWHIPPEITSRRNAEREQFKGTALQARIAA
jgi:lysozyme